MEKHGQYIFEILYIGAKYWIYKIYDEKMNELNESQGYFEAEQEARFAAIGHISLLEKGDQS